MRNRFLAILAAGLMSFPFVTANLTANAAEQNVLLGDANADGNVGIADAIYTLRYLLGRETPTAYRVTAMDANEDFVIDNNDMLIMQQVEAHSISATTAYKELYNIPDNSTRQYYRHDCTDSDLTSYSSYILSNAASSFSTSSDEDVSFAELTRGTLQPDTTNISTVGLQGIYGLYGSGFIVSDHVVATAAHCLYDTSQNKFAENVYVNIYDNNGTTLLHSYPAKYLHVPSLFVSPSTYSRDNYDYGLIYVEESMSDYVCSVGVATDGFMSSNSNVSISGFTLLNGYLRRYYSTGVVDDYDQSTNLNNLKQLRMHVLTQIQGGMSGGQSYYECNNNKSVIGVATGGIYTDNYYSWSVRMTPTLLRFFKYNSNLTE